MSEPRTAPCSYSAFGLTISSDLFLPELRATEPAGAPDLVIRCVDTGRAFPEPEEDGTFHFGDDACFLLYPQIGAFRIAAPSLIEVEPRPGVDPALIAFPLLGPVMALLLQMRGAFLLHGSALAAAEGGRAFAFLGDKGAGKSTTAAAFLRAGYGLLTDDIIAIEGLAHGPGRIAPAFPQVKLAPAASAALAGADLAARPEVPLVRDKRRFLVGSGFAGMALVPGNFYLLARGPALALRLLTPTERMKAFMRFSYGTRFGPAAITPRFAAAHAMGCTALASQARAAILTVPEDLAALDALVDFVSADLAESPEGALRTSAPCLAAATVHEP
ncbi:MAG: serine kinase [Erythrobacter sp.]|uniref:serine kinase n=1 Tax=Erythrobacter sp. TaxID=1042 RepID=UPI0025ECE70E|nr:serine kinase [Erythrobacter sp.]MCM0000787.1 serine kinase [Erythrobacter sp.]